MGTMIIDTSNGFYINRWSSSRLLFDSSVCFRDILIHSIEQDKCGFYSQKEFSFTLFGYFYNRTAQCIPIIWEKYWNREVWLKPILSDTLRLQMVNTTANAESDHVITMNRTVYYRTRQKYISATT